VSQSEKIVSSIHFLKAAADSTLSRSDHPRLNGKNERETCVSRDCLPSGEQQFYVFHFYVHHFRGVFRTKPVCIMLPKSEPKT
jgi:hypothetical protein